MRLYIGKNHLRDRRGEEVQIERAWTGSALNTPHRPSTTGWPPPFLYRVLITLVNALKHPHQLHSWSSARPSSLSQLHAAPAPLCCSSALSQDRQKTQQIPTIVLPAKLVLQPQVVAIRHRTVSEMMAHLSSQPLLLPSIVRHLSTTF